MIPVYLARRTYAPVAAFERRAHMTTEVSMPKTAEPDNARRLKQQHLKKMMTRDEGHLRQEKKVEPVGKAREPCISF